MPAPRSPRRARLAVLVSIVMAITGFQLFLAPQAAQANPGGTGLVISEVYGAGGNSGALLNADYIEVYNPTGGALSLNGLYLHYRSASGSYGAIAPLPNVSLASHSFYLVQASATGANGSALPTPDLVASPALNLAAAGGQVILSTSASQLTVASGFTGNVAGNANVVDMVGASGSNTFEGAVATVAATTLKSISRAADGADTDSNAADFTLTDPSPTNVNNNATPLTLAAISNKTGTVGAAITGFAFAATGGSTPYTYSATGLPDGLSVAPDTGAVSGTPTTACTCSVTAKVTDNAATEKTQSFTFTITAFSLTNPGDRSFIKDDLITPFTIATAGGTAPFTFEVTAGSLPTGLSLGTTTGEISGTPTVAQAATSVTVQATDNDGLTASTTFSITVDNILAIADIQGTGARSTYAPASGTGQGSATVTTKGVITALYNKGFSSAGAATCGFCGFYLQTPGAPNTPGASDAIFVYGFSSFTGSGLQVGDSVRVSGKVSEFAASGDTESLTELNLVGSVTSVADLGDVTPQTTVPVFADREAHEGELFAPTDLVITDTYNFENYGELGLATGGKPLVQPTEECLASDTVCIAAVQQDIKDRGIFFEDGTGTGFLSGSTFYRPKNSANSDIPLPFIDKDHSARVGAQVSFPVGKGGVLDYRNKKWYLQPERAVSASGHSTTANPVAPDLGTDVVTIEDTRLANTAPVDVDGDLKIATYNVENYFSVTGKAFEALNPYYSCEWDYDREDNATLTYQCTSPQAIPDEWDSVTNAPTHYKSGTVSAPRGAARQVDLDRQTDKIVNAINGLGADVVSLEELGNPNKLRTGVTNGPLTPDPDKADGGLGTAIAWRDESIAYLVDHLNAATAPGTWAFVASPEESTDATSINHMCSTVQPNGAPVDGPAATAGTCSWASGQDVIRSGFLYKKATVVPVGQSDLDLPGSSAPTPSPFDNAREPLAQFFKPVGHPNSDGFAVIVNHFKSKGDSDPAATGGNANSPLVGAFNAARVAQAKELLRFANEFAQKWDTTKVFLVGDFNAYTGEDPVQTILTDPDGVDDLDFGLVTSDDVDDLTYVYTATVDGIGYGSAGSLDHVFASADAQAMITGTDVWEINSNEPGVYNYSRFNTNATDFWDGSVPFGGSDHNPEIIGIDVGGSASVRDIQIIGSNDFHGRLLGSSSDGGAAQLAGAVKSLKSTYGDTNSTFVAAGDLIGASTFESFIDKDKPTLKALNAAGLEVSAVGNHEFDQGYHDLIDRVMQPESPTNPDGIPGGIDWEYIGSNVVYDGDPDGAGPKQDGDTIVMPTYLKDFGDGVEVGFVGAVTEDLPGLVSPAGLAGVEVTPIAAAVNDYAAQLKTQGADLVILLVHEGAPSTSCATMNSDGSSFDTLLDDISPDIDAVISGHTHLEYSCSFPVSAWTNDDDHPIKTRPVVSAGQYGVALDQIVYSFDTTTGKPVAVTSNNVGVKGPGGALFSYPEDATVKQIVDDAVAAAAGPGSVVLGKIAGPFKRARLAGGVTENRGGESTLGNLVAEIQRWATPTSTGIAPAQIAFMNPGGLRDDMNGTGSDFPKDVTYKAAAAVQPFANTLVNMDLTGAQIKAVLEQQWQRDASGNVPSRPFLRLGTSKGFTYTYTETNDPAHSGAKLGHVTGMWLNGVPIADATTYSVTMNSFLASGGDNFTAFTTGVDKRDTGKSDLQAQVEYMAANAQPTPLAVDYAQHAVKVTFPNGAPATYQPGDAVSFDLASLAMTGVGDTQDSAIKVMLDGNQLGGTFEVTNTAGSNPDDTAGTASVTVNLPSSGLTTGTANLHVIGTDTGTDVIVPIQVTVPEPATRDIQILATNDFHGRIANDSASAAAGAGVMAGAVKQLRAANPDTVFAAAGDLIGASTFESFILNDKPTIDALNSAGLEVSAVGNHELDKGYDDLLNRVMAAESPSNPDGGAGWQYIAANLKLKATGDPAVPATWVKTMDGIEVGFVGAVTEDLPSLVSPAGIADLEVDDIVDSVNAATEDLKANGADIVVLLIHEGSPSTSCPTMTDPNTVWGHIVTGVNDDVDAIVSGHTHLEYNCSFPVAGWSGRQVTERPVVSAGQYGANLNQLVFTVDTATHEVTNKTQAILKLKSCTNSTACTNYPTDTDTEAIVQAAVAAAAGPGAQVLGTISGPFARAKFAGGGENRGGESTLGNLVAEVQRWATPAETVGAADIAFMNPGGLRADMVGTLNGGVRELTYKQAANVQPFANTLVNMDLTGAQIKAVLEQQWQRTAGGTVPTRAFLRLGTSKGLTYTYRQYDDPAHPGAKLGEVTGMWLNGTPIQAAQSYSVTVNSFLAAGGDNFRVLADGANKQDTGMTDLQAMVEYMAEFGSVAPGVQVDAAQHAVGVDFPADAPATYHVGDHLVFDLSSLSMTDPNDVRDTEVQIKSGSTVIGTAPVTTTVASSPDNSANSNDDAGTAHVDVVVPNHTVGSLTLTVVGATTGTSVPVTISTLKADTTLTADGVSVPYGASADVQVTVNGGSAPTGTVELFDGSDSLGSAAVGADRKATITVPAKTFPVGSKTLDVVYSGDAGHLGGDSTVSLTTEKATSSTNAPDVNTIAGSGGTVTVAVTASNVVPTGTVTLKNGATDVASATLLGGQASFNLPVLPDGTTLTAEYAGDSFVAPSSDTFTIHVGKAAPIVSADDVSGVYGSPVTVTVHVGGPAGVTPSGTVTIRNGGTSLGTGTVSGGVATIVIAGGALPAANTALTAEYGGDSNLGAGTATFTAHVSKAGSATDAKVSPKHPKAGHKVRLKITVEGVNGTEATGQVKVKVGGKTLTATLENGKAKLNLGSFAKGKRHVTVTYLGSATVAGSSTKVTFRVR